MRSRSWYQPDVDKPGPISARNGTSPTDSALLHMVDAAHQRGLKVLWRPCVDPHPMQDSAGKHVWRGDIGRHFTAAEWATWFASYSPFIEHYAKLAEQGKVDQVRNENAPPFPNERLAPCFFSFSPLNS
eukprot:COSAG06_NODE_14682_length_1135_cov_2.015444_2_plen_129_part_00